MSLLLENGVTYRGSILIDHSRFTIDHFGGGLAGIKSKLENIGFSNVIIWDNVDSLPTDWPVDNKKDTSGNGETQIWIEGTWNKETGEYPAGNSDFQVQKYWVQNRPAQPQPDNIIPPIDNNPPVNNYPPVSTNCSYKSQTCEGIPCCEGYVCRQDPTGYWGGGMRCFEIEETPADTDKTPIEPVKEELPKQYKSDSSYWYVLSSMLVGGIITAVGIKYILSKNKLVNSRKLAASEPRIKKNRYFVVADKNDPGSEHDSYEDAVLAIKELRKLGYNDPIIIPHQDNDPKWG